MGVDQKKAECESGVILLWVGRVQERGIKGLGQHLFQWLHTYFSILTSNSVLLCALPGQLCVCVCVCVYEKERTWGAGLAREKAMRGCGTLTKASEAGPTTVAVAVGIDLT